MQSCRRRVVGRVVGPGVVGIPLEPGLVRGERFRALVEAGYLELRGERVGLTRQGFVLADAIGVELMELIEGVEQE